MKQLTHGSLFAGIGGFDLGFERAGIKTVWQVEIDPFCRKVLEKHWPNVQRFEDVRDFSQRFDVFCPDVISGGFPCQDISVAGEGLGIDLGERSGLWREMHRVISDLRPKFAVVENVAALLDGDIGRVLGDLAEIGYDAEWDSLPAAAFGAPHIRERVWIVAYPHADSERCILGGFGQHSSDHESANESLRKFTALAKSSWDWGAQPAMAGVADGIPEYVDSYSHLGNAVVPQIAEWIGRRIVACYEGEKGNGNSKND